MKFKIGDVVITKNDVLFYDYSKPFHPTNVNKGTIGTIENIISIYTTVIYIRVVDEIFAVDPFYLIKLSEFRNKKIMELGI